MIGILLNFVLMISFIVFLYQLLVILANNYNAHRKFRKCLPRVAIVDGFRLFGGHLHIIAHEKSWKILYEAQQRYGEYMGLFWNEVPCISVIDLDLLKMFAERDADKHPNRAMEFTVAFEEMEVDNIATARGDQWKRIRRAVTPALTKHRVTSPNVLAEIERVIKRFQNSIDWRIERSARKDGRNYTIEDFDDLSGRFSLDLGFTCLSKQEDVITYHADKDPWQEASSLLYSKIINQFTYFVMLNLPFVNAILKQLIKFYPAITRARFAFRDHIEKQTKLYEEAKKQIDELKRIDKSIKIDEDNFKLSDGSVFKRNIVDCVTQQYCEKNLTKREYLNTSMFIFLAAQRPIADAIPRIIYLLACNQDCQDKLRHSILSEGLESTYLRWVIDEGLRMFPPIPIGCTRQISHDLESKIGLIPKGTLLIPNTWAIHYSKEYWGQDANEFKPERWAHSDNFHPLQFIPFGAGRRGCPGKELALLVLKMLLVSLSKRYKFERCEKTNDSLQFSTPLLVATVQDIPTWIKVSHYVEK